MTTGPHLTTWRHELDTGYLKSFFGVLEFRVIPLGRGEWAAFGPKSQLTSCIGTLRDCLDACERQAAELAAIVGLEGTH